MAAVHVPYDLCSIMLCCSWFVEELSDDGHYVDSATRITRGATKQALEFEEIADNINSFFAQEPSEAAKTLEAALRRCTADLRRIAMLIKKCVHAQEAACTLFWSARKLGLGTCVVNTQLEALAEERSATARSAHNELQTDYPWLPQFMPPPLHPLGPI